MTGFWLQYSFQTLETKYLSPSRHQDNNYEHRGAQFENLIIG